MEWISNKTIKEVGNITKGATFKKFSSPKLLKHTITFFVIVLFHIIMRKTLTIILGVTQKYELCVSFKNTCVIETSLSDFHRMLSYRQKFLAREILKNLKMKDF